MTDRNQTDVTLADLDAWIDGEPSVVGIVGADSDEIREWLRVYVDEWIPGKHGDHAVHSPSGSYQWLTCSASVEAQKGLPDTSSEFADEGTAAHEIASQCLEHGLDASYFAEWGAYVSPGGYVLLTDPATSSADLLTLAGVKNIRQFAVSSEMVLNVQRFVDAVRDRGGDLHVEQRLDYSAYVPGGFGRGDAVSINGDTLYIDDLKYGMGVQVDAALYPGDPLYEMGTPGNPQGLIYGLGALIKYDDQYDIARIVIGMHQTRLDHITEFEISRDDLLLWAEFQLVEGYNRTVGDEPVFMPTEKGCKFCKIAGTCAARQTAALADVIEGFDVVPPKGDDMADLSDLLPSEDDTTVDNDAIGALLQRLDGIKAWIKAVEAHAQTELENGRPVFGHKLVAGQGRRKWVDEEAAGRAVQRKLGARIAYNKVLLSPAQVEKLVGKKDPLLGKKYVTKTEGGRTIAHVSDKREAIIVNPFEGFDEEPTSIAPGFVEAVAAVEDDIVFDL